MAEFYQCMMNALPIEGTFELISSFTQSHRYVCAHEVDVLHVIFHIILETLIKPLGIKPIILLAICILDEKELLEVDNCIIFSIPFLYDL
jgi:hypothetical protein